MKYKKLGDTGLLVSELCLGTMTFGGKGIWTNIGQLEQDIVNQMVKGAIDAGINFIDTANVYSEGMSETMTGKAIKDLGLKREDLVIATKVLGRMGPGSNDAGLSRKHILAQADASLKRLDMDYVDLYQIHGVDPLTPYEETMDALNTLIQNGKVRYIGCSNHPAWKIMKANAISERKDLARFQSLQAYYTIASRDLEREIVPMLHDQKMGLMVWSPLAGGFLTGKYRREGNEDSNSRRINFDFPPINKERAFDVIDTIEPIAKSKGVSIAQIALAWLLHQQVVTTVIIGAKKMDQLDDNLKAIDIQLTSDELSKLNEVSALPAEYPGWMLERQGSNRKEG